MSHSPKPIKLRLPALRKHQIKVWKSPARHKLLIKGRRWGGTVLGIVSALIGHSPKTRGVLSGANVLWVDLSFPVASTVWRTFRATLENAALEVNAAERTIVMPGGGQITVKSAERPESLIGSIRAVDLVILNEVAKHDPMVWQKAIRPVLVDSHGASLWITTPEFNWVKTIFDAAENLPDWERFQLPSTDNEFFDPEEINRALAEGMPEKIAAAEFGAQFVLIGSSHVFYEFNAARHVAQAEYIPREPLDCCISFRGDPPAFVVVAGDLERERVLAEITGKTPNPRDLIDAFNARFPGYTNGAGLTIYGDSTPSGPSGKSVGWSDFEAMRRLLPRARFYTSFHAAPGKDFASAVNEALRGPPSGAPFVTIDPGCQRLIRDLETLENKTGSFALDTQPGHGQHAFAWAWRHERKYPFGHKWPVATPNLDATDRRIQERFRKGGA